MQDLITKELAATKYRCSITAVVRKRRRFYALPARLDPTGFLRDLRGRSLRPSRLKAFDFLAERAADGPARIPLRPMSCAHRQRTEGSLAEAFALDTERMIKARPVIFPGDGRREFHHLRLVKYLAQLRKQRLRHFDRSPRHERGIFENKFLGRGEQTTLLIIGQGYELFRGDSVLSADRRPDVDSKRTSNQRCHTQGREVLERSIDAAA